MARFLSRSKSHRELRTKFVHDSHEELPSFPPIKQQTQEQKQPHTPAKLTRKRAGTIAVDKSAAGRLMKQKSMDSVLRPATAMSGSSSQRTARGSFGTRALSSPKALNYTGVHPPRTSSRSSSHSPTNAPYIGMALGSPTEMNGPSIAIGTPSTTQSGLGSTPTFCLPPEPFDVGGDDRKMSTGTGPTEPGERGWRKLFGRSLFGTRKLSKKVSQQTTSPYLMKSNNASQGSTENNPPVKSIPPPQFPLLDTPSSKPVTRVGNASSPCLLDVNIPSTEMERYSIMFSSLLQKDCLLDVPQQRKTSIYDRRHERKRSNTTTGAITKKEPPRLHLTPLKRHATTGGRNNYRPNSPNVFDSPDWLPSNAVGIAYSRSPLARSNTTSVSLSNLKPSPGHGFVLPGEELANIQQQQQQQQPHQATCTDNLKRSESGSSKMTQQDPSIDTPRGSFDEGDDEWLQRIDEPVSSSSALSNAPLWEMIKNNPDQPIPIPPVKNEQEAVIAAEISIARQISVSQRQLNHPIVSRLDSTRHNHNHNRDRDRDHPIAIKRQQSAKVMTPRIINTTRSNTQVRASQNVEYGDVSALDGRSTGTNSNRGSNEKLDLSVNSAAAAAPKVSPKEFN